jgi:hypothetical protein
MWKRWIVVFVCLILITIRYIYPTFQIDTTTVGLVVVGAVAFLLPDLKSLVPYIRRIKIGEAELELRDEIEKLSNEVEKAQQATAEKKIDKVNLQAIKQASLETEAILENQRDPRSSLLLLSSKIERQLKNRLAEARVQTEKVYSLRQLAREAVAHEIFSKDLLSAIDDFASIRNRVAHGEAFDVDDNVIYSLISLGIQILNMVSIPYTNNKKTKTNA